jgi:hypothetical protein
MDGQSVQVTLLGDGWMVIVTRRFFILFNLVGERLIAETYISLAGHKPKREEEVCPG